MKKSIAILLTIMAQMASFSASYAEPVSSGQTCQAALGKEGRISAEELARLKNMPPEEAWKASYESIMAIQSLFVGDGLDVVFFGLFVGALAKEFIWINGDPGGAKTAMSKVFYENLLLGLPYEVKKNFFIQFNKLMTENVITGTPKIKAMLKGLNERNFDQSLVNSEFRTFIADEIEKGHTGLQAALLSLLAERAAFAGDIVVKAGIETGVFTSNKTTGQLLESYGLDAPTGEALLDRMGQKIHAVNKQLDVFAQLAMYKAMQGQKKAEPHPLYVAPLRKLVQAVKISDSLYRDLIQVGNEFDGYALDKREKSLEEMMDPYNEKQPYFPANQFSNRSWRKILGIAKASFIAEQLLEGVPFSEIRFTMGRDDIHHIASAAAYNGPGRVQKKSIPLGNIQFFTSLTELTPFDGYLYPQNNEILLKAKDGVLKIRLKINVANRSYSIRTANLDHEALGELDMSDISRKLTHAIDQAMENPENVEFANNPRGYMEDPVFSKYLALPNLDKATREEIQSIKDDQEKMIKLLNLQLEKPLDESQVTKKVRSARAQQLVEARKNKRQFKELSKDPEKASVEKMWPLTLATIKEVLSTFPEMAHVVRTILLAMATDSNVYLFGPPGGAKTAISKALIDAELKTQNTLGVKMFIERFLKKFQQEHPKEFKLYMLQCHQLMPEGQIVGFQNIDAQIEQDGKLEWNAESSLAGRSYLYGIIDEVEKGNSAVIATMLSILQERKVFYGAYTVQATILAAILTSNKTPPEFLEMFDVKDLPTAKALIDRSPLKAFALNKFASEDLQVEYLAKLEAGLLPTIHGPLAINYIKPLIQEAKQRMLYGSVEREEAPNNRVALLGLRVANLFDTERLKVQEQSEREHKNPLEYPNLYVRSFSGSNRSVGNLFDIWIGAKIVDQLMKGIPYEEVSTQLTFKDLGLLAQSLTYAGPYEIKVKANQDGFIYFEMEAATIDQLLASGRLDSRNQFILKMIRDEGSNFVQILNSTLVEYQQENREEIQKYPHLFPEIKLSVVPENHGNASEER